ncbi:hypothetical protein O3G_MSEX012370 [Manduca sexta]|uniref:Uncharacterized protein n=1 Tax=Manduca sexta TaxID=7130 RepID=A0A922CWV8_MANSE|nr:hypothetical protein O3G_MSEX012370 [Manduca sexta]
MIGKKKKVFATLSNATNINEKKSSNIKQVRSWDRKNACCYCKQLVTNFSRHLLRNHKDEHEVLLYASINDSDLKERKRRRQEITDKLRNRGNYLYNNSIATEEGKNIIPNRRVIRRVNNEPNSPSGFVVCKNCLGTFKRTTFFKHLRNCDKSLVQPPLPGCKRRVICNKSLPILPNLHGASSELKSIILPHLRNDEISDIVRHDFLILSFGTKLFKKKKEHRSRKAICSKMRDLATLLKIARNEYPEINTFAELLDPLRYENLIDCIKKMCGFNNETGDVDITSIPARLRPSLLSCVDILYTQTILDKSSTTAEKDNKKKRLDDFKLLLEANWQWEISSNAEKARKKKSMTKDTILPLEEDIKVLMKKIHELEEKYGENLKRDVTIFNYENLCEVTIAHIIMLDRKRSGDVAEAELQYYVNRKHTDIPLSVLKCLTSEQRQAIDKLDIFQIPGKRTRAVPVLLTQMMRENIDTIIISREQLEIPNTNKYLFARPTTNEPFDGGKCLNRIKEKCTLQKPQMLTATGLRHHIATMSQIYSGRNDKYTEHLAGFMGHDLNIHAQNYRLPLEALQKGIVGSRLIEIEESYKSNEEIGSNQNSEEKKKKENDTSIIVEKNIEDYTVAEKHAEVNVDVPVEHSVIKNEKIRNKSKKQQKKSDTDTEESSFEVKNEEIRIDIEELTNNSPNSFTKRKKKVHVRWTNEELDVVQKRFKKELTEKINPGKAKCTTVLREEAILHRRTWMQLNTCVNNIYTKGTGKTRTVNKIKTH